MAETLYTIFPDADDLLKTDLATLAPILVKLAAARRQSGGFTLTDVTASSVVDPQRAGSYSWVNAQAVEKHINSAWNYCERQGLIEREPGMNGQNGWYDLTDAGRQIVAGGDWETLRLASNFPKELLHPSIRDSAWNDFMKAATGSDPTAFGTAVRDAFVQVEDAVRTAENLPAKVYGDQLMERAFDPTTGPLRDKDTSKPESERKALQALFRAAHGRFRNAVMHGHRKKALEETQDQLLLASHLLRIVDEQTGP